MWRRDLAFVTLCLALLATLGATLFDAETPAETLQPISPMVKETEFRQLVERIDATFRADWEKHDLEPAPPADELTILRRLALSLAGTVPSVEEIRSVQELPEGERIETYTETLLADRRSADYLAERYARALVGLDAGPLLLYRRRRFVTWLADQLHENVPYDQIVRSLVSGTGLWTDNPATNFITVTVDENDKQIDEDKLAVRTSRVFLGLRLDCAQCHDHPFVERWKQDSYLGLAAFFGPAKTTFTGLRDTGEPFEFEDHESGEERSVEPAAPFAPELMPEQGPIRQRLAQWITHPENPAFARATVNRMWALMFGRGLVEPVDDIPLDGPHPPALQLLADDFVAHRYDLRRLVRLIAATEVFRIGSSRRSPAAPPLTGKHERTWACFPVTRLRPEQVAGGVLQAAKLSTIDHQSHILVQLMRTIGQNEFIKRYGDAGAMELEPSSGTIPQRLLMLNGNLVHEKTAKGSVLMSAAHRIAVLAPHDEKAVAVAYLACLTRYPTATEQKHFTARLAGTQGKTRQQRLADLYWDLINSTEFSWNH